MVVIEKGAINSSGQNNRNIHSIQCSPVKQYYTTNQSIILEINKTIVDFVDLVQVCVLDLICTVCFVYTQFVYVFSILCF